MTKQEIQGNIEFLVGQCVRGLTPNNDEMFNYNRFKNKRSLSGEKNSKIERFFKEFHEKYKHFVLTVHTLSEFYDVIDFLSGEFGVDFGEKKAEAKQYYQKFESIKESKFQDILLNFEVWFLRKDFSPNTFGCYVVYGIGVKELDKKDHKKMLESFLDFMAHPDSNQELVDEILTRMQSLK